MVFEISEGEANNNNFKIKAPKDIDPATVDVLGKELEILCEDFPGLGERVDYTNDRHPEGMKHLMTIYECQEVGCFWLKLEIPPF